MLGWCRLLLLCGIAINLGIDEAVSAASVVNGSNSSGGNSSNASGGNSSNASDVDSSTVSDVNGSAASDVDGPNASDVNGSNALDVDGPNASGGNSSNASDVNGSNASDVDGPNASDVDDPNALDWVSWRKPAKTHCYHALRHRDFLPPSDLLDWMNHWGSNDFKKGNDPVKIQCSSSYDCQTFTCKKKGEYVFVANACAPEKEGCDNFISKLCKGAGECNRCTNEKADSVCNKDRRELPKKPKNTTTASGAGVTFHYSILIALLPFFVVVWM
uniref:Uncharacterized protein n=1 Tax=Globodera rostochiensis TaxID=31243 RepID=A0A914H6I1_GLORO